MKTSDANYGNKKTGESIPSINSDSVKRREKHAPLYTAGYGER